MMMELVGDYSENPFEGAGNDIPMLNLCRVIDFAAYAQQYLAGLQKGDDYFTAEDYHDLHYQNEVYAIGWGHDKMQGGTVELSTHTGSAGAFLAMMIVVPSKDLGVLVVTNIGDDTVSEEATQEVRNRILREHL